MPSTARSTQGGKLGIARTGAVSNSPLVEWHKGLICERLLQIALSEGCGAKTAESPAESRWKDPIQGISIQFYGFIENLPPEAMIGHCTSLDGRHGFSERQPHDR